LVLSQMQTVGVGLFGVYFNESARPYYDVFIGLLAWLSAAAISGTLFALIFGGRARLRWFILLAGTTTLPWWVSYLPFYKSAGGERQLVVPYLRSHFVVRGPETVAWIGVVATGLVAGGFIVLLLAALWREQVYFRRLVLAGMAAWLPLLVITEIFAFTQPAGISDIQNLVSNALLGALLGGMLGLLLKDRRKLPWLLAAGLVLYPVADYVFFHWIYAWLITPFFPVEMSIEQAALQNGLAAAVEGIIFGLPLAIVFVWLARGNFPQFPRKEMKDAA
jgi:hypothetical protein